MALFGAAFGLGIALAGILGWFLSKRPRPGADGTAWHDASLDDWREERDAEARRQRALRDAGEEPKSGDQR
ncbi:MAG: hypothetical protein ACKVVT_02575 [Dehalococcoidia bacterium]